jgi:hypothetical protein
MEAPKSDAAQRVAFSTKAKGGEMSLRSAVTVAVTLSLTAATWTFAQQKEIPGEMVTIKGQVEAIDHTQRVLTLKMEDDKYENINVPEGAKGFDEIKIGDSLQVRYYDNVTARLKKPGEPDVNMAELGAIPAKSASPGGTISAQRRMTVKVTAIDHAKGVATYEGPNGYKYSRRIQDKEMAKKLKVGDKIDVTWTEAVQISVIPGK